MEKIEQGGGTTVYLTILLDPTYPLSPSHLLRSYKKIRYQKEGNKNHQNSFSSPSVRQPKLLPHIYRATPSRATNPNIFHLQYTIQSLYKIQLQQLKHGGDTIEHQEEAIKLSKNTIGFGCQPKTRSHNLQLPTTVSHTRKPEAPALLPRV